VEVEVAYHIEAIGRVLREPVVSTASLPKQLRILEHALAELGRRTASPRSLRRR
jgi:hypothetical protein